MRFDIAYGRVAPLLKAVAMSSKSAYAELDDDTLTVKMGWSFSAKIPLESITAIEALDTKVISIGVHGWRGRWLVNGKGDQLVRITIDPSVNAKAVQYPVKLKVSSLSLDDVDGFVAAVAR
jgi:hypothetical protein